MNLEKLKKLAAKGRVKAIVKEVSGRRMLIGFERINPRSRKFRQKQFLRAPMDLDALVKDHETNKAAAIEDRPGAGTADCSPTGSTTDGTSNS